MANFAAQGVPDDQQAAAKQTKTDDSGFAIGLPRVFDVGSQTSEDLRSVFKIKSAMDERPLALGWIVRDLH